MTLKLEDLRASPGIDMGDPWEALELINCGWYGRAEIDKYTWYGVQKIE